MWPVEAENDVLRADGLTVGYEGVPVVEAVDVVVRPGRIVTLIGPNGAGKSTLLKTLAGYLPAVEGCVYLTGTPIERLTEHERALVLSVMLTERLRTELLTCLDVVEMGRYPHTGRLGIISDSDREVVRGAMELVGVWDLRHQDFMRLSDGQRQRVLLARAICQEPRVMVLDEPTNYLDIRYQIELLGVLRTLAAERDIAIVMSLHELPLAHKVSDWVVCVKDGEVVAQGLPSEIFLPSVIDELYDLETGTFDATTGAIVLPPRETLSAGRKGSDA